MTEDDIRAALAAEAGRAVPGSVVVERLRAGRKRRTGLAALVAVGVAAAVAAVVIPLVAGRDATTAPVVPATPGAPQNVVVIGSDGDRADTVMLVRVDAGRVNVLSLPRDAWVAIPGHGMGKLNSAYAQAGPEGVVGAVEELTGQEVDHYAAVDMAGFQRLADAVGGVEVCLRAAVSDEFSGARFPAGEQRISGAEALAFVRQRHGLPNGDLDRVARQQAFARALVDELVTTVLTDPAKRADLTALVADVVTTDPGWSPVSLAADATGPVRIATIPIADPNGDEGGIAVLRVDPAQVRAFTADFFTGAPVPGTTVTPPAGGSDAPSPGCVN
ncbi:LCP family protein [Actinokineospora sp. NPDC004072]